MSQNFTQFAFTESVKSAQARYGTRQSYAGMETAGDRYPNRQRLKLWVEATIIEADQDAELSKRLEMPDYKARIERLVILTIQAYDWNCPQHIMPRYTEEEFQALLPV